MQSAVLTLLSFAVLISVLVFFHEMGHLLVGKLFNVKVLRFSIGFGPKLFGFQRGETEYRVSALPLGGYVKFAGDVPGEELEGADRGRGYLEQPPFRKACIAFAGPAANFILAALLFIGISAAPRRDWAAIVGQVKPKSPAATAGVKAGDLITAIDGEPVSGFQAFQEKIRARPGKPVQLAIVRDGKELNLEVNSAVHEEKNPLETVKQGRIGIALRGRLPQLNVLGPDTAAAKAGLQAFDVVTALDGKPVATYEEFAARLEQKAGQPASLDILRRSPVAAPGVTLWTQAPMKISLPAATGAPAIPGVTFTDAAAAYGLEAADLTLFVVQPGSAADKAGLRRGDRIVSTQGKPAYWWQDDVDLASREAINVPLELGVLRAGKLVKVTVAQTLRSARDEAGVKVQVPELGASPDESIFNGKATSITVRYPLSEAAVRGVAGTGEAIRGMALGIVKLVTGDISREAIGGPLMIADVARSAADAGILPFLSVMAMISISLGLMNLIPIPVLDGFHILSAAIEGVSRRPLSLRFREIANMVGVALVLSLMLFALRNDVVRKFFD